jgi:hypothetical protein
MKCCTQKMAAFAIAALAMVAPSYGGGPNPNVKYYGFMTGWIGTNLVLE